MARVVLDLNNPEFQRNWFSLEREEQLGVLSALGKIQQMEWDQLYRDRGLRWEAIQSRTGPNKGRIYSLRITRRSRAVAYRDGNILRFLTVHGDHDAAYRNE
jgi:hypothetical protein